ncbi:sensor histidine kinase [Neorhodopirellula pilleata]|uniref:histidine kinase n=1 Tax=Neorhodopirellula pilleata TaxID=2714738 RepID=A0A5C6A4K8_9BACT|nr:ATP-binding protein [Neorhodopirellula pilleata]TWT94325.1 Sensor protein ZraS [Neorhodopirellula pilleata]
MSMLFVEPEGAFREFVNDRFHNAAFPVHRVANSDEARRELEGTSFLATIFRWDDNSPDLIELLRAKSAWLIATVADESELSLAYRAGVHDGILDTCVSAVLDAKRSHIEHLHRMDQRLAQAQKLESIGELAAGIAHEINTPIQYVGDNTRFVKTAYADLTDVLMQCRELIVATETDRDITEIAGRARDAMDNADLDYLLEEIPAAIEQTLEGIDRVSNIVRAMKEFAHPGVSEMVLTDLSKAIQNTVMVARNEWKYVAEVKTDFDPALAWVPCFPGELNQVLLNMIVNAAHAIGERAVGERSHVSGPVAPMGTISISTQLVGGNAVIRICDTGNGIAAKNLERIFDPFFTTKASGKGTGQGLAIAHTVIVERHRGTIGVQSKVGQGTEFTITLPMNLPEPISSASNHAIPFVNDGELTSPASL